MTSRSIRTAALLGALLLVLAACGGPDSAETTPTLPSLNHTTGDDTQASTTTTEAIDPEEALQQFTECMRENGFDMPDPVGGAIVNEFAAGDLEVFEAASAECDPILEAAFGEFELSPEQEAELRDQELAFARCMRDNGLDWPDPDPDNNTPIVIDADIDPEVLDAAITTCSTEAFGEDGGSIIMRP